MRKFRHSSENEEFKLCSYLNTDNNIYYKRLY